MGHFLEFGVKQKEKKEKQCHVVIEAQNRFHAILSVFTQGKQFTGSTQLYPKKGIRQLLSKSQSYLLCLGLQKRDRGGLSAVTKRQTC